MNEQAMQIAPEEPFSFQWWMAKTGVVAQIQAQASLSQKEFTDALDEMLCQASAAAGGQEDEPEDGFDPNGNAARLYKANLPQMSSRREVQLYIAAVAQGVQHDLISGGEAKLYLYTAQLALAAFSASAPGPEAPLLRHPRGGRK